MQFYVVHFYIYKVGTYIHRYSYVPVFGNRNASAIYSLFSESTEMAELLRLRSGGKDWQKLERLRGWKI